MQRNTVFLLTSNQLTNPRFSHLQGKMSVHKKLYFARVRPPVDGPW